MSKITSFNSNFERMTIGLYGTAHYVKRKNRKALSVIAVGREGQQYCSYEEYLNSGDYTLCGY